MYVIRDPLGPAIGQYSYNKRFKARILKYWPKKNITEYINGVPHTTQVFDRLYLWWSGYGVLQTEVHKKIYALLGIKVSDLQNQDYSGVDNTYLDVTAITDIFSISANLVRGYLRDATPQIYPNNPNVFSSDPTTPATENHNPDPYQNNPIHTAQYLSSAKTDAYGNLTSSSLPEPQWDSYGWVTDYVQYQPHIKTADIRYADSLSDTAIINLVKNNDYTYTDIVNANAANPAFFAALKDTAGVLYEKRYRIVEKQIIKKTELNYNNRFHGLNSTAGTSSEIVKYAVIEVKYRRIADPFSPTVDSLISAIQVDVDNLDPNTSGYVPLDNFKNAVDFRLGARAQQMKIMHQAKVGYGAYNLDVAKPSLYSFYIGKGNRTNVNSTQYLSVEGMTNVRSRAFSKLFGKAVKFGYTQKEAKWWQKLISIVITIVAIVVAVISEQWYVAFWAMSIGALAQTALAMYWQSQGEYAAAAFAGGQAQILGYGSMITGTMLAPWWLTVGALAADTALKELGVSGSIRSLVKIAIMFFGTHKVDGKELAKVGTKETTKTLSQSITTIIPDTVNKISSETINNLISEISNSISKGVDSIMEQIDSLSIANVLQQVSITDWIKILNMSLELYSSTTDPSGSINDKKAAIAQQEKELGTSDTPETLDTVWKVFSDPYDNWIDTNTKMEKVPIMATHGLNAKLMNKYYDSGY